MSERWDSERAYGPLDSFGEWLFTRDGQIFLGVCLVLLLVVAATLMIMGY